MQTEIAAAIAARNTITVDYEPGERLIEPHVLGRGSEGQLLLRAYQVSGASKSGEHENWKLFRVDRIGSLCVNAETFSEPRPLYNPDDSVMKGGIMARV